MQVFLKKIRGPLAILTDREYYFGELNKENMEFSLDICGYLPDFIYKVLNKVAAFG